MRVIGHLTKMWIRPATASGPTPKISTKSVAWALQGIGQRLKQSWVIPVDKPIVVSSLLSLLESKGLALAEMDTAQFLDESTSLRGVWVLGLIQGDDGESEIALVTEKGAGSVAYATRTGAHHSETYNAFISKLVHPRLIRVALKESLPQEVKERFGWAWFLSAMLARKKVVRDVLVASLLIQLVALSLPLATQAIVDKVITHQANSTLLALGIGISLFAVFSAVMGWLRQSLLLRLANVVDGHLASQAMEKMLRLPMQYFEARPTGVLITRFQGIERVREFASGAFLLVALEIPFVFIFLALMVSYSPWLSGLVLAFLAIMLIISWLIGPVLRNRANTQFQLGAKMQGFLTEQLSASETLKSLQLENHIVGRYAEINQAYLDAALRTRELANSYGTFMGLAEQLLNASVLCVGAWLAMSGDSLTIGMLVAFQMFTQRVSQPLLKLSGMWQELQQIRIAVTQLGDILDQPSENYAQSATSILPEKPTLTLDGLSYNYAADRPRLYNGLSLSVPYGQVLVVTGVSGSGKSTLAKLLLRLYPDYKGSIRINGRDTRTLGVNELRGLFGVVPQETILFSGTIAENVLAGSTGASFADAVQACKMAGVHDVVENLPNGYQTEVGERGVGLSGGQKQRLSVARALVKHPKILIFDESTSGLDDAAAEHIGETVNWLRGKATVVFIAHKVPVCLKADQRVTLGGTNR